MMHPRSAAVMLAAALFLSACGAVATTALPTGTPSATPKPPTATSTSSPLPPTATATLPPPPRTFTEGFDAASPYWQFLEGGAPGPRTNPSVEGGTLSLELKGADQWAYALYEGQDYGDVRIDTVVDFGSASSAGVICRYSPADGWYEFDVYADGSYSILFGQWLLDGVARYTPLVLSQSDQILSTVNEIGLVCQGNILTPYVNSVQLRRRQETQRVLTTGQVGLSAASSDAGGATISYDWVSVGNP